jgi:hypothetical protein
VRAPDQLAGRLLRVLGLPLCLSACVESSWTVCAGGRVCGPGRVCDEVHGICSGPDDPCLGAPDGTSCGGSRFCQGGTCTDTCGDGLLDETEVCDPSDPATPPGMSCIDFGFDAGREGCAGDCASLTRDACMHFGWTSEDLVSFTSGDIRDLWGTGDDLLVLTATTGVISSARNWVAVGTFGEVASGRALWASSQDDIWVIDLDGGGFWHWDGGTWTAMPSPERGLNEIWGSSAADVFAVGDDGAVVHYDGERWRRQVTRTSRSLRAVWGVAADQVYAAGDGGGLLRYDGSRWSAMDSGTGEALTGLWADSGEEIWTASPAAVRRFDGNRWVEMSGIDPSPGSRAWIAGTGPSDVWLSTGSPGTVRRYDGMTWSTLLAGDSGGPHPLWVDRNSVAVGFTVGSVQETVRRWFGAGDGPALATRGLWTQAWSSRTGEWIAIGNGEDGSPGALHSDGRFFAFEEPLISLAGVRPDRAFAAGQSGTIYVWNGGEWAVSFSSAGAFAAAVWASASADVYAAIQGQQGPAAILHLDGERWDELPAVEPPCSGEVTTGWASGPDDVFVGGLDNLARFDGARWTCFVDERASRIFASIWGSGRGDVWIGEASIKDLGRLLHWDGARLSHWVEADGIAGGGGMPAGLVGTAADDVFLGSQAHFDGRVWSPIRYSAMSGIPLFALPSQIIMSGSLEGNEGLGQFVRTRFWNQRLREVGCTDGVDDDGDGATDLDDEDCAGPPVAGPGVKGRVGPARSARVPRSTARGPARPARPAGL